MHVLHVIDSLHGGGAESSILEIAPGLERRGVVTSIVTLIPDDGGLADRLKQVGITPIRLRNKRPSPFRTPSELLGVIRSLKPDVVHTTLMYSNLLGRLPGRLARAHLGGSNRLRYVVGDGCQPVPAAPSAGCGEISPKDPAGVKCFAGKDLFPLCNSFAFPRCCFCFR